MDEQRVMKGLLRSPNGKRKLEEGEELMKHLKEPYISVPWDKHQCVNVNVKTQEWLIVVGEIYFWVPEKDMYRKRGRAEWKFKHELHIKLDVAHQLGIIQALLHERASTFPCT